MDDLYTKYFKFIEHLFKTYSGARTMPGKPKFVSLEELRKLVTDFELDSQIPATEVSQCYNESMMSQVDELETERCAEMSQIEFMEALARLAELANMQHIAIQEIILPEADRKKQKLHVRTEAFLKYLSKHPSVNKKLLASFSLPPNSLFDAKGELIDE